MDLGLVVAVVMIVVWAVGTFVFNDAPGWIHLLLTTGVFLAVLRIVVRGTPPARARSADDASKATKPAKGAQR
jgi:hypothetical protein